MKLFKNKLLESELQGIIIELSRLLLQLNTFISQFHNFVLETGINVVTDASGALSIDYLQLSMTPLGSLRDPSGIVVLDTLNS